MDKKLLFIYNPSAGKNQIRNHLAYVMEAFRAAEYEVTVYPTMKEYDARDVVAREGERFDYVVCSGGDGTLNEVVNGLMAVDERRRPPCGYIPSGTVNDFATSLGIPKRIKQAVDVAANGAPFSYDVGYMEEASMYFAYIAAFGAFANVSYDTPNMNKNVWGKMAYVLEGVKSLPAIQSYHLHISYEGGEIEDDLIFGMVTNSHSVGGFKGYTGRNVDLNDGLFEVAFVKYPKSLMELQGTINALLSRKFDSGYFYYMQTPWLTVRHEEGLVWTLDGEYGGLLKEAVIRNCKGSVQFIVKREGFVMAGIEG